MDYSKHETKHEHRPLPKAPKKGSAGKLLRGLTGVAILQVVLLVVIAFQLSSLNSNLSGTGTNSIDAPTAAAVAAERPSAPAPTIDMKALEDDDAFLGPEDAKVTIVEFSDFECPYCAAAMGTNPSLISRFKSQDPSWEAAVPKLKELAEEGKIKLVFRDFPLSFHKNAQKSSEAAECAKKQGKFWEMHDKLFEEGVAGGVSAYKQFAADLGLNTANFNKCLDDGETASEVRADFLAGQKAGVSGTPAFFINGQLISGAQPFSVFEQVINAELAG